jgi:hypothetical protein
VVPFSAFRSIRGYPPSLPASLPGLTRSTLLHRIAKLYTKITSQAVKKEKVIDEQKDDIIYIRVCS